MTVYRGQCHCGAIGFDYETATPTSQWPVRACQCTFCLKHGGVYTSDPSGSVRFTHEDPALVSRYRFGHQTADFMFCGRCGGYFGAVTDEDRQKLAVLCIRALDPQPTDLPAAQPMTYDWESSGDRNTRRSARWTRVVN